MTPFGLRLQLTLDLERQRMKNEWFFKWHFIGRDGPVEIDGFDGRKICYGGIKFEGTSRLVYWATLARYLKIKVGEVFDQLDSELVSYPGHQVAPAISDTKALVSSFARGIANDAIEKDRILRGDGINFPNPDTAKAQELLVAHEIEQRTKALSSFYKTNVSEKWFSKTENFLRDYKEITAILLIVGGALGTLIVKIIEWILQ